MAYTSTRMRTLFRTLAVTASVAVLALALLRSPASAVVVDGVAAVVNGEIITLLDLEKAGRIALEERLRTVPAADQERVRREVLTVVLDQLVLMRIQSQRARQAGIQVSPAEVDAAIAGIREENKMSEEVLARLLQAQGVAQEDYRRDIEDQIRQSKLVQHEIRAKVAATDADLAAWYQEHRLELFKPERIRIRHLLVPVPTGASQEEVEAAQAKATELLGRARSGVEFAALVREQTPGSAADADPVSGEITRNELFPALETAAFALPVGGVSQPVRSPAGFHLVQVAEKTPAYEPTLAEIRALVEQKIVERKTREGYEAWVKKLRAEAIVEIRF